MSFLLVVFISLTFSVGAGGQKLSWTQNFADKAACESVRMEVEEWVKINFKDGLLSPEPKVLAKCYPTASDDKKSQN
jgi:hypothetical protein